MYAIPIFRKLNLSSLPATQDLAGKGCKLMKGFCVEVCGPESSKALTMLAGNPRYPYIPL